MEQKEKVVKHLEDLNISYKLYEHEAANTVADAQEAWSEIAGIHCKNLFFRDTKGRQHYLVVLEQSKQLDIKKMGERLGNQRLSFASEKRLMKYLGLTPGSVTPFGLINDVDKHVKVFFDADIRKAKFVNFHPNINTATLNLSFEDFELFLKESGQEYHFIEID